jgi:hypothetical protein
MTGQPSPGAVGVAAVRPRSTARRGSPVVRWVTERWDSGRWIVEDADGDRLDLSPDEFRPAGPAWLACRRNGEDPGSYGNRVIWGWPEPRGSLLSDAAALLKEEQFTWQGWELAESPPAPSPEEDAWLDRLAEVALDDVLLPELEEMIGANPGFSRHPSRLRLGLSENGRL